MATTVRWIPLACLPVGVRCHRATRLLLPGQKREVAQETHVGVHAEACAEEVRDLGDDQSRDDGWSRVGLGQLRAGGMVAVIAIHAGVEGNRVDDQCDD